MIPATDIYVISDGVSYILWLVTKYKVVKMFSAYQTSPQLLLPNQIFIIREGWYKIIFSINAAKILATRLTHWGRVRNICVSKPTIIGSDIGLSPGRRQAIIWTSTAIVNWPLGANFTEILIGIDEFSFRKMHLKMSSGKWQSSCLGLDVLMDHPPVLLIYWYQAELIHG